MQDSASDQGQSMPKDLVRDCPAGLEDLVRDRPTRLEDTVRDRPMRTEGPSQGSPRRSAGSSQGSPHWKDHIWRLTCIRGMFHDWDASPSRAARRPEADAGHGVHTVFTPHALVDIT